MLPRLVLPLLGKMAVFPRPLPSPSPRPVLPRPALPLPGKMPVFPWPLPPPSPRLVLSRWVLPLPGKTTVFPRLLPFHPLRPVLSCPHQKAADLLILPGTQAGLASNNNNTLRQGSRCPPRQRPTQASQEVNTTSQEGNNPTTPH